MRLKQHLEQKSSPSKAHELSVLGPSSPRAPNMPSLNLATGQPPMPIHRRSPISTSRALPPPSPDFRGPRSPPPKASCLRPVRRSRSSTCGAPSGSGSSGRANLWRTRAPALGTRSGSRAATPRSAAFPRPPEPRSSLRSPMRASGMPEPQCSQSSTRRPLLGPRTPRSHSNLRASLSRSQCSWASRFHKWCLPLLSQLFQPLFGAHSLREQWCPLCVGRALNYNATKVFIHIQSTTYKT